ncbi:hypothetical protein J6590_073997 [Homalodisca vitripennis]|nr:hypothetical protein J6590_073997 [Homalodisca vitripennis]
MVRDVVPLPHPLCACHALASFHSELIYAYKSKVLYDAREKVKTGCVILSGDQCTDRAAAWAQIPRGQCRILKAIAGSCRPSSREDVNTPLNIGRSRHCDCRSACLR